eukprot:9552328-Lingulodinium_polyedra.AAC.1
MTPARAKRTRASDTEPKTLYAAPHGRPGLAKPADVTCDVPQLLINPNTRGRLQHCEQTCPQHNTD